MLSAAIVCLALLAPVLPLQDPNATAPANRLLPPLSPGHLLGTDHLGRDLLSRLCGARGSRCSSASRPR
jgi:peptide/nickel transport system permease protein